MNCCLTRNGDEVVIATSGIPVFDEDGELKGYRGGDRDITKEVKTTELLKKTLATTRKILESLPVGVVLVNRDKRIRQMNKRACAVLGREREELIGEMCHSALCPALMNQCPILDHDRKIDRAAHSVIHKDGHIIPVVKSVIPIQLDSEDLLLEVFIDVSEIESLETNLKEKNRELSRVISDMKESAGRISSRSQKTRKLHGKLLMDKIAALGCITGMVDLLLETEQTDEQSSLLTAVQTDCVKLTNGVRLMQDKMGGYKRALSLEMNEFLLRKLMELVVAPFRGRGVKRCADIRVQIDPLLPDLFFGPIRGIEAVLQVLMDYSVSNASESDIEIGVTYVSSKDQTMEIRFSVSFSGNRYFPAVLKQLFTDTDSLAADSRIAASRKFALSAGGELCSRDTPGSGSAFWLTIPLERRENKVTVQQNILEGVHVLVMESDTQLRSVYLKMLQCMGCRVTAPADQTMALRELREAAECNDPVRIAVLDRDFSGDDGLIVARLIRNDSIIGSKTALVICSPRIIAGDIETYQQDGYSALLRKPLNLATLRICLIKVLSRSGENLPIITEYSLP
ncbi:MAG: PAS domain S-box protein [Candidatus Sabulitectum sp.]|nr:PAS domain S-box protein [Candidatus Sabulitectum sp.]